MRYGCAADGEERLEKYVGPDLGFAPRWMRELSDKALIEGRGVTVPTGRVHAAAPGAFTTACGLPLAGLAFFPDMDFERPPPAADRCGACAAAI